MKKTLFTALLACVLFITNKANSQNEFITEWVTTDGNFVIPTSAIIRMSGETAAYVYNYKAVWINKATNTPIDSASNISGDYPINNLPIGDTIVLKISGNFPHFYMNYGPSRNKLVNVKQWGNIQFKNWSYSFYGCYSLKKVPLIALDLTQINNLSFMFASANTFNSDISSWDVSNVTRMDRMFENANVFNQDLSTWDVSNVTNMFRMFDNANTFNGNISTWDVSNVTNMYSMFTGTGMSYCNMDAILNAWAPVLLTKTYNIESVPAASTNSAAVRTSLGGRISLAAAEITNPISNSVVINTPSSTCIGEQISFTATSAYAASYKWNNAFIGNTYTFNVTQDTLIHVIAFDSLNCRSYDTITVIANTVPTVTISADTTTICNGNAANLTAAGADSYVWSTQATGAEITVAPTTTTTYTVTGTIANGCENTASVTITEVSPIVTISADTTTICNGNSANLTATGAHTYVWSTQATDEDITVTPITTTTYTVTGTDANGCENTASVEITVEECVGIDDNTISFTVYPNPAAEYVVIQTENVDLSNASIALLDITGKVLVNTHLTESNTMISIAHYPAGVYFIKVQVGSLVNVQKLVKR